MRKTLETTETSGRVLMISNGRSDRVRRGVRSAGDHAVGIAHVHHHGAEVRRIRYEVGRLVVRHALVGAQARVLGREAVDIDRVERAQHVRARDVEAELDRARAHLERFAEDRQLGHPPLEQDRGGLEDAVVIALGQHDAARSVLASGVEQLVLEHERRTTCARATPMTRVSSEMSTFCSKTG